MPLNLKKKKKQLLETWIQLQMEDQGLREDLLSNEDLRVQSDELITSLLEILDDPSKNDIDSNVFDPVVEIISTITVTRARQGFSPRETGLYIFSMKDAFLRVMQTELQNDHEKLYN